MADDNFDVDSLADYLHLSPAQVAKLADRGKLPGRKIAGVWRFAPAEIHHWLEEQIGVSDADELLRVEGALDRVGPTNVDSPISIAALLPVDAIAVPLAARTRDSVIRNMVDLAAHTGCLWDVPRMAAAVRSREDMYPTTLDNGTALLHPRRPLAGILSQPLLALGVTESGIPFASGQGLTNVFFLICSVDDWGHLRTLARLSRLLSMPTFLEQLRVAPDAKEAHAVIVAHEAALPT